MDEINPAWAKLRESINEGGVFNLTLQENALERLENVDERDVIRLAVIGDIGIVNTRSVVRHLCTTLSFFMARKNVQVITTDRPGADAIVVKACERNGVDVLVLKPDTFILDTRERREALFSLIIKESDALLVITEGKNKAFKDFINEACEAGVAVMKRTVRRPTNETPDS